MKIRLGALVVAVLFSAGASKASMNWQQRCEAMSRTAKQIMLNHQARVPLQVTLEAFVKVGGSADFQAILRRLTMEAYETPRYNSPKLQANAVQDYMDATLLDCLKAE